MTESRSKFAKRAEKLEAYRTEMTALHRQARETLETRLQTEWDTETSDRAARLPKGMLGLWHRLTGKYQQIRRENEAEADITRQRHAGERQGLVDQQLDQRQVLQDRIKEMRSQQAEQLLELRQDVGRYVAFSRGAEDSPSLSQGMVQDTGQGLGRDLRLER